jgi:hypothetical protein
MELMQIRQKIYQIRDEQVMLDFDLAEMFEVETRRLVEQVKRNEVRFPKDFMFRLTKDEWVELQKSSLSQIATSSFKFRPTTPLAFTEHGVTMLANILRSDRAVKMSIAIVRAFIAMRKWALNYKELADKIAEMEQKYDKQFADVYEALRYLMAEKQSLQEWEERERIGFKKS